MYVYHTVFTNIPSCDEMYFSNLKKAYAALAEVALIYEIKIPSYSRIADVLRDSPRHWYMFNDEGQGVFVYKWEVL
jgi:hypothetical protein